MNTTRGKVFCANTTTVPQHQLEERVRALLDTVAKDPDQLEVAVPRTRENGSPADVLGRYRRRSAELDEGIVPAYVSGASTRDIGNITEALVGKQVSRSTVSRVTSTLNEVDGVERKAELRRGGRVHILRHTFCSRLAARNVPMPTIKELAGYISLETTMRYMAPLVVGAARGHQSVGGGRGGAGERVRNFERRRAVR
jgi:hypothetical protein